MQNPPKVFVAGKLKLIFDRAAEDDASELAALHTAVARSLRSHFGTGRWCAEVNAQQALRSIRFGHKFSWLLVARCAGQIVGTLRLATKKPWAIDLSYFTPCARALYIRDMAVSPARQREGIGAACLEEAKRIALAWPAQTIRLDAYDAPAGAGSFYSRCGFREVGRVIYRKVPLIYLEQLFVHN
jgi:GNAT superfamily N-acetyltransferase